jgi:hypothetical protein
VARVDDAVQVTGLDHVSLLTMSPPDRQARSVAHRRALRDSTPNRPTRYAGLLALQARITRR